MKKIGDLMRELGFNENAPVSTQKAFIKNLLKEYELDLSEQSSSENMQLSFDAIMKKDNKRHNSKRISKEHFLELSKLLSQYSDENKAS